MAKSLSESLRRMMPAEAVVEALIPELLSTAQELLATAEQKSKGYSMNVEEDDPLFEDLLSEDEMESLLDEYSKRTRENASYQSGLGM